MKKIKFDLDDEELEATKELLRKLGRLFLIILFLGTITGIVPFALAILLEKFTILMIPLLIIDIIWIMKELCYEGE